MKLHGILNPIYPKPCFCMLVFKKIIDDKFEYYIQADMGYQKISIGKYHIIRFDGEIFNLTTHYEINSYILKQNTSQLYAFFYSDETILIGFKESLSKDLYNLVKEKFNKFDSRKYLMDEVNLFLESYVKSLGNRPNNDTPRRDQIVAMSAMNPHENEFEIKVSETNSYVGRAKIYLIGIGGGGGNAINHIIREGIVNTKVIAANTDAQALDSSLAPFKIQLGINATRGLGAGMIPDKGREAALESFEDIKEMLDGSDIVFISAGLGGGTGTGAAPIIAQAAKEVGALTVSIVTSPFKFEGRKRTKLAKEGLEELKRESDSIIVVPNEKLLFIVEKNLGIKESFRMVDDILAQAVGSISKVILSHGEDDINLDFADVKTIMSHRGLALMGTGYAIGINAALDAAIEAIESPLLDNISINGAMGVLVHFDIHPDYPIVEIGEAMSIIEGSADKEAAIIFGTTTNADMEIDEVKITIIATGFEDINSLEESTEGEENNIIRSILSSRKVVGGYDGENEDILDIPTFLRRQMD